VEVFLGFGRGYGAQQVRLAQANAGVDEKGIVVVTGVLRDGTGSSMGQLIGTTDDEVLECVSVIEGAIVGTGLAWRGLPVGVGEGCW